MAELTTRAGLEVLALEELHALGVDALITTRTGGVSSAPYDSLNLGLHVGDDPAAVLENRSRAAAALGMALGDLVVMDQVHGARVALVDEADRGRGAHAVEHALSATDALVTTTVGLPLVALAADCSTLVLIDPIARVLGVVHAGWRGAVAGAAEAAVASMTAQGAAPERITAVIGPTIDVARYEVGHEVAGALDQSGLGAALDLDHQFPHADVAAANRAVLLRAGVPAIAITTMATTTQSPLLFSDRAARPCGRFALIAVLRR